MKLLPAFAKKLFAAVVTAIIALLLLMIPVDAIRIQDEFLRLMLGGAIALLIIYIFYTYRMALKEASLKSLKETVKKFEPGFVFPDEPGFKENGPDN
jgi:uncharacterized membrane protein YgaE (UPF0421/DUF939 family)